MLKTTTTIIENLFSINVEYILVGKLNYLFLTIGASSRVDYGEMKVAEVGEILSSNFLSVLMAVQIFRPQFVESGKAGVIGFSSVAAIRGRGKNVIYAASKRAVESYFESLKLITYSTNVSVQLYRLGFIDTYQAYGEHLPLPKADPKKVARMVVDNLHRSFGISYYPRYWRAIAILIRLVPLRLYKKATS